MKRIILILIFTFMCLSSVSAYESYNKGDVVKFANANWIVIENSSENDDYVTVIKDKLLTHDELSEYAAKEDSATMSYYYSDTCYYTGVYGHDTYSYQGCPETAYYDQSKIKEFLENVYLPRLGEENLKSISGYKIRVLKSDEILSAMNNYSNNGYIYRSTDAEDWLYKDSENNILSGYWSDRTNYGGYIFYVFQSDDIIFYGKCIFQLDRGVRPVINLLKSSIELEYDIDPGDSYNNNTVNKNDNNDISDETNEGDNSNTINPSDNSKIDDNKTSEVVKVPNTLMRVSMLFIICGFAIVSICANIYIIKISKKNK